MEIHAHTHTERKRFTHYLWEFLMLFLAVFCGFLAENFREHQLEHQREKQYMQSFIYDLQNDTANLNAGFPLKEDRIKAIDSVLFFFETHLEATSIPGNILRHIRRTFWDRHYRRNSTTIDQLKNAGGLRMIQNKNVRDSIAAYDLKWQRAEFWRENYITSQDKEKGLIANLVNVNDLLYKYRTQINFLNDSNLSDTIRHVHIYTEHLNEFLNTIVFQKIATSQDENAYEDIELSAERLIAMIKKEYHFK